MDLYFTSASTSLCVACNSVCITMLGSTCLLYFLVHGKHQLMLSDMPLLYGDHVCRVWTTTSLRQLGIQETWLCRFGTLVFQGSWTSLTCRGLCTIVIPNWFHIVRSTPYALGHGYIVILPTNVFLCRSCVTKRSPMTVVYRMWTPPPSPLPDCVWTTKACREFLIPAEVLT